MLRLKAAFSSFRQIVGKLKVAPMTSAKAVWCARELVKHSFGAAMERVWEDFPGQKIARCREVFDGSVELPIPNYLKVSKSEKYCEFFIKANRLLLEDIQAKAFRALRLNRFRVQQFRCKQRQRLQRHCLYALHKGVQGQMLISKYIQRSSQLRVMRFQRDVFDAFRYAIQQRIESDDKFCVILKTRKERIIRQALGAWLQRYAESSRRSQHEKTADGFYRER